MLKLKDEVGAFTTYEAPGLLRALQTAHSSSGLSTGEWEDFAVRYRGDVGTILSEHLADNGKSALSWKGVPQAVSESTVSLLAPDADLAKQPLSVLEGEIALLQRQVNLDRNAVAKFSAVSKRIADDLGGHFKLYRAWPLENVPARA